MNGEIELITGTMGGGKTSYAVAEIMFHLRKGGTVYTNIEMVFPEVGKWLAYQGLKFDPTRLVYLNEDDVLSFTSFVKRGSADLRVMLVIDECALNFNSRDFQETAKREKQMEMPILHFNVLVRKLDIRLLYLVQASSLFDKQMRTLCQTQTDCRNLKHMRLLGVFPCPIPLQFRVHFVLTLGVKTLSYTEYIFSHGMRWVWPLYKSDALLGRAAGKFGKMEHAATSPLERIKKLKRPSDPIDWLTISTALCTTFFASF